MGDRANIKVVDNGGAVYLYAHSCGSELPMVLRKSLGRAMDRWNDGAYLTRIIFCDMIYGEERETTGFGISTEIQDGADRILEVNIDTQTVRINDGEPCSFVAYANSPFITW